jgi:hypothetical protein
MNIAHVRTDAVINNRSGMTGDFADFAIRSPRHARVGNLTGLPDCEAEDCLCGSRPPRWPTCHPHCDVFTATYAVRHPARASVTAVTFWSFSRRISPRQIGPVTGLTKNTNAIPNCFFFSLVHAYAFAASHQKDRILPCATNTLVEIRQGQRFARAAPKL